MKQEWLIIEYHREVVEGEANFTTRLVNTHELFEWIDKARNEPRTCKIAVYEVGERLLDWS